MPDAQTEQPHNDELAAAISNLTVQPGRGPTRARTHISGELVAVVVHDAMTKEERSLIRDGEQDRVLDTRQAFQRTMRTDLAGGVAQITGREVVASMSANHIDPDVGVEIFIVAPDVTPGSSTS